MFCQQFYALIFCIIRPFCIFTTAKASSMYSFLSENHEYKTEGITTAILKIVLNKFNQQYSLVITM